MKSLMSPVKSQAERKIMFRLNSALAASRVVAMLGGLACSPRSAESGGDGAQASFGRGPSAADAPGRLAAPAPPPAGKEPANPADAKQTVPGGKSDASVKDPDVIEAANFACTAEQDALKAQGHAQAITLVEITAAKSQVVAGVSYDLTLRVKVDGQDQTAEAVVWVRAWLKGDDKIKLTSWKLADKRR